LKTEVEPPRGVRGGRKDGIKKSQNLHAKKNKKKKTLEVGVMP